jgi:hypothetical protein
MSSSVSVTRLGLVVGIDNMAQLLELGGVVCLYHAPYPWCWVGFAVLVVAVLMIGSQAESGGRIS